MNEINGLREYPSVPGFVCPAEFWPAFGYHRSGRYVAIWWERYGDEASWEDGREMLVGAYWPEYLNLINRNFPKGHEARRMLGGSDMEATHRLVIDRETGAAWLVPLEATYGLLEAQWPSGESGTVIVGGITETKKALKKRLNRMVEDMARYDERSALLADTNRRVEAYADKLDVALEDARYWKDRAEKAELTIIGVLQAESRYWKDRAEKAEAEVAMRPVTPDVL